MKTSILSRLNKSSVFAALAAVGIVSLSPSAQATNYAGNGDGGFGGAVGHGVLTVTDDHTNITVNLQRGSSGTLDNLLVIYIDTGVGGPTDTSGYTSAGGDEQRAISGYDGGGNRSVLTFTNGFKPAYAVAIKSDYMDVWSLANPANFSFLSGTNQGGNSSANFSWTFNCSQLGLTANTPTSIRIFGTFISNSGYRSTEAIAGNIIASQLGQGWHPFTNTVYATYNFSAPPAPTYPVTFSVDMSAQVQLGNFVPGTDPVYCGGSFQTNPFAFTAFPLVQKGSSYIYTNSYPDADLTNTVEAYKFMFHSVANNTDNYDEDPNRSFTLTTVVGGQVLPLVYFDNIPATPSATTNLITFSIDMGPQIYLGHFAPAAGDLIQVFGSFEQPHWSGNFPPIGYLTNNPTLSGNASNIYSGTFVDGNYPGTVTQYRYAILPISGGTNYEETGNRTLVTPTNAAVLPLAYFSGVSTYAATPVTFSVDMTVPILTGLLNPANGDIAGCAGTFQTNAYGVGAVGFTLTNNPSLAGSASNIYSGTYIDRNVPGSFEQYKFVINNSGGTVYESPVSTGGGNRSFSLGNVAVTNPLVRWGDRGTNDVILVDTTVTFQVNMTNAFDRFGVPFNPDVDRVMVDGDFYNPQWQIMNATAYNDATIELDHPGNIMNRDTDTGLTYSLSFVIPAGNTVQVTYKYGILRNAGSFSNTNIDNEAGFAQNHLRFIRTTATGNAYNFPLDNFGQQRTDLAGATELLFGKLAISRAVSGSFPINWVGIRGVHLQSRTNLISGAWVDVTSTDGASSANIPTTKGTGFFRLIKP